MAEGAEKLREKLRQKLGRKDRQEKAGVHAMDTVQKKTKRKFDALGAGMSSPHEKRNTSAGGTPISPERFDLPQIQSFESVRKKGREGHTVRFMEVHEKKVSSMGTITLHPNEIKSHSSAVVPIL